MEESPSGACKAMTVENKARAVGEQSSFLSCGFQERVWDMMEFSRSEKQGKNKQTKSTKKIEIERKRRANNQDLIVG